LFRLRFITIHKAEFLVRETPSLDETGSLYILKISQTLNVRPKVL
jgi:hypothetical protein